MTKYRSTEASVSTKTYNREAIEADTENIYALLTAVKNPWYQIVVSERLSKIIGLHLPICISDIMHKIKKIE